MIFTWLGKDTEGNRVRLRKELDAYTKKTKATEVRVTADQCDETTLVSLAQHTDLFSTGYAVFLDGLLGDPKTKEILLSHVSLCKSSDTKFFVLEGAVDAATKKTLQKVSESFEEHDGSLTSKRGEGDFFLAQAFGNKDRAKTWVLYQKSLLQGSAPEMIHGMLFWKAKQMIKGTAARSQSECRTLLGDLAELPSVSRQRNLDFELALERFILER